MQAKGLATRRGQRYLSAEDLIFLIRHDRGKVNRLRTYLSWKEVRKTAKDSGGDAGANLEPEGLEDGADGMHHLKYSIPTNSEIGCKIK